MQRTDQNPGGIIVLTEDSMPQLARCVADILREEFRVSSPSTKSSIPAGGADELISKARACEILDRCDSTLSKWAKRGILVPIRRHGSLYYRLGEVMKVYNGEL